MELAILGTANLIAIAIFVALSALPFYLLHRIGAVLDRKAKNLATRWLLPFTATGLVAAWTCASFLTFQSACEAVPGITVLSTPSNAPIGFRMREAQNGHIGNLGFNWPSILETGAFQFVDTDGGRQCIGEKAHERQPAFPITNKCDPSLRSTMVVNVLPHRAVEDWWSPPIFDAAVEVRDSDTDQVLAKASELIFGGGLIGKYLRLLGGDQDFERLSCGFASRSIGPWRPSLTSRPRFTEYQQADLNLLKAAAGRQ